MYEFCRTVSSWTGLICKYGQRSANLPQHAIQRLRLTIRSCSTNIRLQAVEDCYQSAQLQPAVSISALRLKGEGKSSKQHVWTSLINASEKPTFQNNKWGVLLYLSTAWLSAPPLASSLCESLTSRWLWEIHDETFFSFTDLRSLACWHSFRNAFPQEWFWGPFREFPHRGRPASTISGFNNMIRCFCTKKPSKAVLIKNI